MKFSDIDFSAISRIMDSMSDEEFEQMISASLEQAKRGESIPLENLDLK